MLFSIGSSDHSGFILLDFIFHAAALELVLPDQAFLVRSTASLFSLFQFLLAHFLIEKHLCVSNNMLYGESLYQTM